MNPQTELLSLPWAWAGLIAALISIVAYFLMRQVSQTDRLNRTMERLDKTMVQLSTELTTLRDRDSEKTKIIERLSIRMTKIKEALVALKTSVEHCQAQNENCSFQPHKESRI